MSVCVRTISDSPFQQEAADQHERGLDSGAAKQTPRSSRPFMPEIDGTTLQESFAIARASSDSWKRRVKQNQSLPIWATGSHQAEAELEDATQYAQAEANLAMAECAALQQERISHACTLSRLKEAEEKVAVAESSWRPLETKSGNWERSGTVLLESKLLERAKTIELLEHALSESRLEQQAAEARLDAAQQRIERAEAQELQQGDAIQTCSERLALAEVAAQEAMKYIVQNTPPSRLTGTIKHSIAVQCEPIVMDTSTPWVQNAHSVQDPVPGSDRCNAVMQEIPCRSRLQGLDSAGAVPADVHSLRVQLEAAEVKATTADFARAEYQVLTFELEAQRDNLHTELTKQTHSRQQLEERRGDSQRSSSLVDHTGVALRGMYRRTFEHSGYPVPTPRDRPHMPVSNTPRYWNISASGGMPAVQETRRKRIGMQ